MGDWTRFPRLYAGFARYCLVREMGFRANFVVRCLASALWLFLLVTFFRLIFLNTKHIGDWSSDQYLIFMGTGFILNALVSALFMENCTNFSELIRTGDLDFALTKPIDEQFLLSCQRVDWAALPNVVFGAGLVVYASVRTGVALTPVHVGVYALLLLAGLAIMYSLMLTMACTSVWIVRNRGLYEVWFYVTQFARYPADIYRVNMVGNMLRFTLMYLLPILLAINVPARYGAELTSKGDFSLVGYLLVASAASLLLSRRFFRFALKSYRSASS